MRVHPFLFATAAAAAGILAPGVAIFGAHRLLGNALSDRPTHPRLHATPFRQSINCNPCAHHCPPVVSARRNAVPALPAGGQSASTLLLQLPPLEGDDRVARLAWLYCEHRGDFEAMRLEPNANGACPLFTLLHFGLERPLRWLLNAGQVSMQELLKPTKRGAWLWVHLFQSGLRHAVCWLAGYCDSGGTRTRTDQACGCQTSRGRSAADPCWLLLCWRRSTCGRSFPLLPAGKLALVQMSSEAEKPYNAPWRQEYLRCADAVFRALPRLAQAHAAKGIPGEDDANTLVARALGGAHSWVSTKPDAAPFSPALLERAIARIEEGGGGSSGGDCEALCGLMRRALAVT